jgi:hypothetical protein
MGKLEKRLDVEQSIYPNIFLHRPDFNPKATFMLRIAPKMLGRKAG